MASKLIYVCSCGDVFAATDTAGVEAHLTANPTHGVYEAIGETAGTGIFPAPGGVRSTPSPMGLRGDGYYRLATAVDVQESQVAFVISDVVLRREIAGISGTTTIDILVNGTSIWSATPANRPSIVFSAGDQARVISGAPDNPDIAVGDRVEMDIVAVEGGHPQDLVVLLRGE
jgi:hypothetical protein